MMQMNKIIRTSVGADLSCPPPLYRPALPIPLLDYFVIDHYRVALRPSRGTPQSVGAGEDVRKGGDPWVALVPYERGRPNP